MISEVEAENAVLFLRDTAKRYGQLRGRMSYCDDNLRRVKALEMIVKEGKLGEREAAAYASDAYKSAIEERQNATADYETLRAEREACVYAIDLWRSLNAARRQGVDL